MNNGQKKLQSQSHWLKNVRAARSVKAMAEIVGVKDRTWYHWEAGTRKISPTAKKLLEIEQSTKIHDTETKLERSTSFKNIIQLPYPPNGKYKRHDDLNLDQLLDRAKTVLISQTIYRTALAANINAFYHSILTIDKFDEIENRLANLENSK